MPLPEGVKIDAAIATITNGVLEITMPMARIEMRKRVLEIKEAPTPTTVKHAA